MKGTETLEGFNKRKLRWIPENLRKEIGHFNIFRFAPEADGKTTSIHYRRREFFEVMIVKGNSQVYYAGKVIKIKKQALIFFNPRIPYKWDHLDNILEGICCVFTPQFFYHFEQFPQYEVFQTHGKHIFELTNTKYGQVHEIFEKMFIEFNSEYKYKFDLLRNFIFEIIHFGLKQESAAAEGRPTMNASRKISALFHNLLERQFPIDSPHQIIGLRSASDFAFHLNVHVNYLNKALKETTHKTTTEIISNRILQEAKILLKHSFWNISEIAFSLGFKEVTHFNNYFKKQLNMNPSQFRNQ